jgi:hypothetical protein
VLLESKSANTGYPLLVLLARYQVLQKSIKERKVYFLDSFGRNHFLVIGDAIQNKSFLTGIYRQISKKMNSLFLKMAKQDILLERDYTIFEDMANREREEPIRKEWRREQYQSLGFWNGPLLSKE